MTASVSSTASAQQPTRDSTAAMVGRVQARWYTWLVAMLVGAATLYGLLAAQAYRVTDYLALIWRSQDIVTLGIVPALVVSASRARAGSLRAHLAWVGLMFWLAYAYAHYAVGAPYTTMFLVYVAIVGLSAFAVIDGLLRIDATAAAPAFAAAPRRAAAWFLMLGGLGIAGFWLAEIVAALPDGQPASNLVYDMPSPTYVLDFALLIPFAVAAGWMLRRGHRAGPLMAAVVLVLLFVLSLAMLTVTVLGVATGLAGDPQYAQLFVVFGIVFGLFGVITGLLLAVGSRRLRPLTRTWLHRSIWC